jgi:hypothetical protein
MTSENPNKLRHVKLKQTVERTKQIKKNIEK